VRLNYDEYYTNTLHSPGIESWIFGFLKSMYSLDRVLDIDCCLGFLAPYSNFTWANVEYLVGVDISPEEIDKAKRLNLYDELYIANIEGLN
jgi:predicted TPR repeat methyltransferase